MSTYLARLACCAFLRPCRSLVGIFHASALGAHTRRPLATCNCTLTLAHSQVDHLVFGVPGSLEEACAQFHQRTGIAPAMGGVHKGLGTRNAIVALGGADDGSDGASNGCASTTSLALSHSN